MLLSDVIDYLNQARSDFGDIPVVLSVEDLPVGVVDFIALDQIPGINDFDSENDVDDSL